MTDLEKAQQRIIELLDEREVKRQQYEKEINEETKWKEFFKSRLILLENELEKNSIGNQWNDDFTQVNFNVNYRKNGKTSPKATTLSSNNSDLLNLIHSQNGMTY